MNTVSGMEQTTTPSWRQQVKNFFSAGLTFILKITPLLVPIFLATAPTNKVGYIIITILSGILFAYILATWAVVIAGKKNAYYNWMSDKTKKRVKIGGYVNFAIFGISLIIHVMDAKRKTTMLESFFNFKIPAIENTIGNNFIQYSFGNIVLLIKAIFGLLYFTCGGYLTRLVYNQITFESLLPSSVTGAV